MGGCQEREQKNYQLLDISNISKNQEIQNHIDSDNKPDQNNHQSQKLALVARDIKAHYSEFQNLSMQLIIEIQQKCLVLARDDFQRMTVENRKQRRQLLHTNLEEYSELILQYHLSIEELLDHKQNLLLNELGIEKEQINKSFVKLMESGQFEQFQMVLISIREKMKQQLVPKRSLDIYELKEVVKQQISLIQERKQELTQILAIMNNKNQDLQQFALLAISTVIADMTYEKLTVEEEEIIQILVLLNEFQQQEVHQLMVTLDQAMIEIISPYLQQQK